MELFIDGEKNMVHIQDQSLKRVWKLGTIEICFGDCVDFLNKEFPKAAGDNADFWVSDFLKGFSNGFSGKKIIWSFHENGLSIWHINQFLKERANSGIYYVDPRDVEGLRISHNITFAPLPLSGGSGLHFPKISSPFQILYGMLYFYAMRGYALKRCKFCGRWFAVRASSAQKAYCGRKVVYTDWSGKTTEYLSCQKAVETITDRCDSRYKQIKNNLDRRLGNTSPEYHAFCNAGDDLKTAINKKNGNPSIANLQAFERFLYIESANLSRRYERNKSPSP